ncbi:MAG: DUF6320 domain-containing protein [Pelolinea sp.]|nr:DUF6320 domain-containing protein [Pelolinea sp.]
MSYCVNCGVKLNHNVSSCPLCGVEIINPADPIDQTAEKIFPQSRDVHKDSFDKSLWIKMVTTVLGLPMLLSITINTIFGNGLNWSLYVTGTLGIIWVWLVSPFLFKRSFMARSVVIDAVFLLGFLYLIEYLSHSQGWFFSLAFPIIGTFTILLLIIVILIKRKILKELHIVASIFLGIGIFCVILNGIINFHALRMLKLDWSLLVLIPFTAFALIAALLQQRRWIVEELKHWFHV